MIIADILCVNSCLKLIFSGDNERKVYFFMRSEWLLDKLAIQFLAWLGWELIPLEYDLMPDNNNMPLFDVRQGLDLFVDSHILPKIKRQINGNSYFSEYEKKRVLSLLEFLSKKELYRSIEMLYVIQILRKKINKPISVLLFHSQWSKEIAALFKKKGFSVNFYSFLFPCKLKRRDGYIMDSLVIQSMNTNLNFLFKIMYISSNLIWDILVSVSFRLYRCLKSFVPDRIGKFDIAVHIPGYERTEWFNDLFWKKELKGQNSRTLAILFGSLDESAYKSYGYLAERWVTLTKFSYRPNVYSIFYWVWPLYPKILMRNLINLLRSFIGCKAKIYYWFEVIKLCIETSKMETLFSLANTKVFWTSVEGQELTSVAGSLAINRLNGVTVGSTWSMVGFSEFGIYKNTVDVFFIWGNRHSEIYRKEPCKAMVVSGYPGDFYLRDYVDRARYLRQKWQREHNARIIVCCYDNVVGNDMQHFIPLVSQYFENLLQWIREKPDRLLAIKAKRDFRHYPVSVLKELELLQKQKKLVYEFGKADLTPGFASDLVISPGISSLASILGAYGKDVILLDANRINDENPLDLENIKYISNPQEIKNSLEDWQSKINTPNVRGINIIPRPSRLDPFVDGNSHRRIAGYLKNLISELNKCLTADLAIQNSNQSYSKEWGTENVMEIK